MDLFNKIKNKLGFLALFALLFQLTMPVYQTYVFATDEMAIAAAQEEPETDPGNGETEVPDGEDAGEQVEGSEETEEADEETVEEDIVEQEIIPEETEETNTGFEATNIELLADGDENEKQGFALTLGSVTDLNNKPFTDENLLNPQSEFYLKLNWKLKDKHGYNSGDKVTFNLPKGIKIEKDIPIELKTDDQQNTVANAIVKPDGTVELTFTEFVKNNSNVTGWMEIISKIDEENAEVEDNKIVLQPIGDEGIIRIPVNLGERKKTIEKKGTPNKGYNADEINWEVIINKMKIDLTNANLTDVLPEGTAYKEGSLNVTKLKVDLNGNVLGDLEGVNITDETVKDGILNIPLGNIKDAYKIEYITSVTDDEQKIFENNVTLSDDNLDDISTAAKTTIKRGEALNKSAGEYNAETKTISWTVEFNYNGKDLKGVNFTDSWEPEGRLDYVKDSLKFQEMTIDENGRASSVGEATSEIPGGGTVELVTDGFKINGISTEKPYKITYKTKLKDRVIDSIDVENTAKFGDEPKTAVTNIGQLVGKKSAGSINYADKTIDWTIRMNQDKQLMKNISLVDTLGSGLTLDKSTIEITVGGVSYDQVKHGNYTVSDPNLDNEFTISFPDGYETDKEIVITYTTKYDADKLEINTKNQRKRATNGVLIKWMDEKGEGKEKKVGAGKDLNEDTMNNHWKNGSYNPETKEITWTIYTNYRENQIGDLKIEDIPQGNQKIIADSAIVTELEVLSNGKMKDIKELDDNISAIDTEENLLTVSIGTTNKAYRIQYRTSLKGLSDIQKKYVNKAKVLDGNKTLSEIDAKVGIAKAHTYGAKSGRQDGKQVHWAVTVNPGQQRVKNLKLEDTISSNQEILTDTFKVYEANVDIDGNATKKGNEIPSDQYELKHVAGDLTFTVEWKNTVEHAFIVEYSTLFFEKHAGKVTNSYIVTGDNIVKDGKTDGNGSVTIEQLGSGGASGEAGYLIIDKVDITDTDDGSKKLGGATFDLIDADTGKVLKTAITDDNGFIDFGRLLYGTYKLVETKTPEGYVTKIDDYDERGYEIEIATPYIKGEDATKIKHKVENYVPVFAIELFKTGTNNVALPGAEFALYDSEDVGAIALQTAITDSEGKILFEDLNNAGTYYVQEIKSPKEYILDKTRHKVTVGAKEQAPVKIELTNKAREGKIEVSGEKIWKDANPSSRPESIKISLTRQLKEVLDVEFTKTETVTPNEEGKWVYTFGELDQFDEYGVEYEYIVKEEEVPAGYRSSVNGYDITNLRVGSTSISGTKRWKDDTVDARPASITVNLLRNGQIVQSKKITKDDDWSYDFTNLSMYDSNGKYYSYRISEEKVPGYVSTVQGNDIINTRSEKTAIEITKSWLDDNAADRPTSIEVEVYRNDEFFDTVTLTAADAWAYEMTDLEGFDEEGQTYTYTIEEEAVDGYEASVKDFDITNLRIGTVEVNVLKHWVNDEKESRPETIEIDLLQNGKIIETVLLSEATGWKYTFTDLAEFDQEGKAYEYSVQEKPVKGYRVKLEETDAGFEITNTYLRPGDIQDTEKPGKPGEEQDGSKPTTPGKGEIQEGKRPVDGVESQYAPDGTWLPKTGETSNIGLYLVGSLLIIGGLFVGKRRIKEE